MPDGEAAQLWDWVDAGTPGLGHPDVLRVLPLFARGRLDGAGQEREAGADRLAEVAQARKRWRVTKLQTRENTGRPEGSGIFTDGEDCRRVLESVIQELFKHTPRRPTEAEVAVYLVAAVLPRRISERRASEPHCDDRTIREWLGRYKLGTWAAFVEQALTKS